MADVELVIKISEKVYNALTHIEFDANLVTNEMRKSIANGIPLPKGHGNLIDEDELLLKLKCWDAKANGIPNYVFRSIKLTSVVIETDKGVDS